MSDTQAAGSDPATAPTASQRIRAHAVHLYTAAGIVIAFLVAVELVSPTPSVRLIFILLAVAVLVDATDGPLARRWDVERGAPEIDGRTIDDIVDYLTYTFLPLLLVWRMGWLPDPALLWIVPALLASLFGFANAGAKDEAGGFFLGFPSYWNIVAFYLGIWYEMLGAGWNAGVVLGFALLTLLPIRFVYLNLAPRAWGLALTGGAVAWLALAIYMLADYPAPPAWTVWLSLLYPLSYLAASLHLWRTRPAAAG